MSEADFDKMMREYVRDTAADREADFAKLNRKKTEDKKNKVLSKKRLYFASYTAIFAVIVLAMTSIICSFVFSTKQSEEHYGDSTLEFLFTHLEGKEQLLSDYNVDIILPKIDNLEEYAEVIQEKESANVVGAKIEIAVYDEAFDSIVLIALKKQVYYAAMNAFAVLSERIVWNGITVRYQTVEPFEGFYEMKISFEKDDYNYYITAASYIDMTIPEVLDEIFE